MVRMSWAGISGTVPAPGSMEAVPGFRSALVVAVVFQGDLRTQPHGQQRRDDRECDERDGFRRRGGLVRAEASIENEYQGQQTEEGFLCHKSS